MSDYGLIDRGLHRLVLGLPPVAEMFHDLDQKQTASLRQDATAGHHVFVSGLARAGTTALMRRIHASGAFRSLTYADMPFVLAPNVWSRLRGGRTRRIEAAERAHGDGVIVDAESPESLDEVFWRIFDGPAYIAGDRLKVHAPDAALCRRFADYVAAILVSGLVSGAGQGRYLSKNNNNLLRLPALARTFPGATILVPFRAPLDHAASLRNQHLRFAARHGADRFERDYMRWLVHHEFGSDHRPFDTHGRSDHAPDSLAYWLDQWVGVHEHLLATAPASARFVCYEDLCADPAVWAGLARALDIAPQTEGSAPFVPAPGRGDAAGVPPALLDRARALYDALRERASLGLRSAA